MIEIVVAHYNEELDWLRYFPEAYITVYSKGEPLRPSVPAMVVPLPNTGREAGSWLCHIVHCYDRLADVTIFLQGDALQHCPLDSLRASFDGLRFSAPNYIPLAAGFGTDDRHGQPNNWRERIPVGELYERIFNRPPPPYYTFGCGGQFAATRAAIQSKPLFWWLGVKTLCEREYPETFPWVLERIWHLLILDPLTEP